MYEYKINNIRVIDGDTIEADVDVGMNIWLHKRKIRLFEVDTWEVRGPNKDKGLAAKAYLQSIFAKAKDTRVRTLKDKSGKYGRLLGVIYVDGQDVNQVMRNLWSKQ